MKTVNVRMSERKEVGTARKVFSSVQGFALAWSWWQHPGLKLGERESLSAGSLCVLTPRSGVHSMTLLLCLNW